MISKEELILHLAKMEWHLESDCNLADAMTKAQLKERLEFYDTAIRVLRLAVMEPRKRRTKDEIAKANAEAKKPEGVQ